MKIVEFTKMKWTWRDPANIRHTLYKGVSPLYPGPSMSSYETPCGLKVSVDDVPNIKRSRAGPTCMRCAVAPDYSWHDKLGDRDA